jgi:hypothetical protein
MRTRLIITQFIVLMSCASPAGAFDFTFPWTDQQVSFEIAETMVSDYHADNFDSDEYNDDYFDIRNRLNLKLAVADFTFSLRIDTSTFISEPAGASPAYLDRYAPEKWSAAYHGRNLQVTLGDVYGSFGRGIALRIRKTDQLAEDTTLMGGKVTARLGELELLALGGLVNPTNTDGVSEKTISDYFALKTDVLAGLRAEWKIKNAVNLGVHGLGVFFDPFGRNAEAEAQIDTSILPRRAFVGGASLQANNLLEWADLYAEFDWMHKSFSLADLPQENGQAFFFGSNAYFGNWTLTAEVKHYDDYELYTVTDGGDYLKTRIDYIRPPTLEPEDMEVRNNRDVTGARLRVDWRPAGGDTLLFASYAGFVARDTFTSGEKWWVYNTSLGAEQEFLGRGLASLDAGLREETPLELGGDSLQLVYLNASVKLPLSARHSLDLHGNNWWGHHRVLALDHTSEYLKGEWTLGYSWSPWLSVSLIVGYDTELSGSRKLDVFFKPSGGSPIRQVFLAGGLTVNIEDLVVVKLLAGQLHGGPKCVNGSCRIFPPFSGVRLEATLRI